MRLVRDTIVFTTAEMPRWHSISISGYHIREGFDGGGGVGLHAGQRVAYVELALQAGLPVDAFAPRLSFFFNAHIDFFEEIAKYAPRASGLDEGALRGDEPALDATSLPLPDGRCIAHGPAARGQPGAHRDRGAGRGARRSPVAAHQLDGRGARPADREVGLLGAAHAAGDRLRDERGQRSDPLGGSWFVESSPTRWSAGPRRSSPTSTSWAVVHARRCGRGIEDNWFQGRIGDSSYELEKRFNADRRIVVASTVSPRATTTTRCPSSRSPTRTKLADQATRAGAFRARPAAVRPPCAAARRRRPARRQPHADAHRYRQDLRHTGRGDGDAHRGVRPPRRDPRYLVPGTARGG